MTSEIESFTNWPADIPSEVTTTVLIRILASYDTRVIEWNNPLPEWYSWLWNTVTAICHPKKGALLTSEYGLWKIEYIHQPDEDTVEGEVHSRSCLLWNVDKVLKYLKYKGII